MKKIKLALLAIILMAGTSFGQSKAAPWPEMSAFHTLMAATFHPSEDGDLKPLRSKADSLYQAARAWQNSKVPADYKPEETKIALDALVRQCGRISKLTTTAATDEQLKKEIGIAHEDFHKIVGECRKAEGTEKH